MFRHRVVRYCFVLVLCATICMILFGKYAIRTISNGGDVYRLAVGNGGDVYRLVVGNGSDVYRLAVANTRRQTDGRNALHNVKVNGTRQTKEQVTTNIKEMFHACVSAKIPADNSVPKEHTPYMLKRTNSSKQPSASPVINYNKPIKKTILSKISTIFSDDYVPDTYATTLIDNSIIHICQIVAKAAYALEVDMFVRSVILHARRSEVFFHFIATEGAEETLPQIFQTITHAFVNVKYEVVEVLNLTTYLNDKFQNNVRFFHPWSGIYGTGKIFMYDLLPNVNKCIVIDSDTLFGIDPAFLWNEAKLHLQPPVTLATTWSPTPEHFNSGVMVHDFERMRKIGFSRFITMKGCKAVKENGKESFRCEHDQHLLLQILKDHGELFYLLNISWNLDNCSRYKKFKFDSFYDKFTGYFFGVVHFCCFPTDLKYAYERGARYIYRGGLVNYFNYLKAMNFSSFGETKVIRVNS